MIVLNNKNDIVIVKYKMHNNRFKSPKNLFYLSQNSKNCADFEGKFFASKIWYRSSL